MKVLLREEIEALGQRGEIVDVADGYARNYLLPRRLAVPATTASFRQLEMERARIARLSEREKQERSAIQTRLETTSCTLVAAASPDGHLYGSVGPRQIAAALADEGFDVDEHCVQLDEPLKEIGVYIVDLRLDKDTVARTRMWIMAE